MSATSASMNGSMNNKRMTPFDPKVFLAKVGTGRTISSCKANQIVFSQGDPADSIFWIPFS
jgi:CRP/FNR family transcriptional regulator, cyclic AMP receptor protein